MNDKSNPFFFSTNMTSASVMNDSNSPPRHDLNSTATPQTCQYMYMRQHPDMTQVPTFFEFQVAL